MKTIALRLLTLFTVLLSGFAAAGTGANVKCWAPGMSSPITLDSHGQGIGVYCGNYAGYTIYGVGGTLTLGDQCDGAFPDPNDSQKKFRQGWWIGGLGGYTNISSNVELQVNWAQYYPKRLEVTGDRPGVTSGPVRLYGDTWETNKKFGYSSVTVVFHLAGNLDYTIPNRNPNGFFYVVGETKPTATVPTGTLTVSSSAILRGNIAPVGYNIVRGATTKGETPPFTGYNTGGEVVFLANK